MRGSMSANGPLRSRDRDFHEILRIFFKRVFIIMEQIKGSKYHLSETPNIASSCERRLTE